MAYDTGRDLWIAEVLRTPRISDAIRVLLLALAFDMDEAGVVELKQKDLAVTLARAERRIRDRISEAEESGFLRQITRGRSGRPSRYQATTPTPLTGPPGVRLEGRSRPVINRTHGGPLATLQADDPQPVRDEPQPDPRGSGYPAVSTTPNRTPGGPVDDAPIYKARARARISTGRDDTSHLPDANRPVDTPPPVDENKISQSAQRREACRWLKRRYHGGLTDQEATAVIDEVARRAARPIRNLVPYLAAMKEGDLADIVGAVMDATDRTTQTDDHEPASRPALAVVPPWCGACESDDHRFIDLPDGRVARCPRCHPNATRNAS